MGNGGSVMPLTPPIPMPDARYVMQGSQDAYYNRPHSKPLRWRGWREGRRHAAHVSYPHLPNGRQLILPPETPSLKTPEVAGAEGRVVPCHPCLPSPCLVVGAGWPLEEGVCCQGVGAGAACHQGVREGA